ncbi:uncharacterized protein PAC_11624 [Phialocephala subalpina]|uniref:Uncharacterized protein n=1 Tax=Phialocephala subalpina TaxID=576137 RepID=A0A1L7X9S6_9HELO|nr:uncharacterized protein PAC_11624 [Phialocephala subalpina]
MTSVIGSSSRGTDPRIRVPVNAKLASRFYEPIVLLKVLNATCDKKPSNAPDPSPDMTQSPEHTFQWFVNTLAQLCDSDKGGKTVTAFTVLQHPDHIEYRFTSNQRGTEEFIRAQTFTSSILHILGSMQGHEKQSVISDILRRSLSFSRSGVTVEVRILKGRAEECISACEIENTDECEYEDLGPASNNSVFVSARSILEKLKELYEGLPVSNKEELSDNECEYSPAGSCSELNIALVAKRCEILINSISRLHQSEVHEFICNRTKEGRMDQSEKWSELRHTAGRLLSYLRAAKSLVSMPKRWPELFENPRVCYVPSSVPDPCPFRGKRSLDRLTAHGIIGRMTSDLSKQEEYRAHAQQLQKIGLDKALQGLEKRKFRPIVHAEVLLLESLESAGGTHPSKFFKGYKYIGCSKPTCRLCCHYFSVHPSGVEVRRTHHNLYPPWRMPDVYENQGPEAERGRKDLMNQVLSLIRVDTFRVLKEKLAEGKRHDSNTESTYPRGSASVGSLTIMEDQMSSLRILDDHCSGYEEMSSIAAASSLDEGEKFSSEVDYEENSGVKLLWAAQYAGV